MRKSHTDPDDMRTIADRLHSAAIHVLRSARRHDAESGIGPAQLSALSVLVFRGPLSLGELATIEQVQPPTMTRIVTGLEERSLATRTRSERDAREVRVSATKAGEKLLAKARERRVAAIAELLDGLSADELTSLRDALDALRRATDRK